MMERWKDKLENPLVTEMWKWRKSAVRQGLCGLKWKKTWKAEAVFGAITNSNKIIHIILNAKKNH